MKTVGVPEEVVVPHEDAAVLLGEEPEPAETAQVAEEEPVVL